MPVGPDMLVRDYRGSGSSLAVLVLRGGTIAQQIGQLLPGTNDNARSDQHFVNFVARIAGRWLTLSRNRVYVYAPDRDRWLLLYDPTAIGATTTQEPNPLYNFSVHSGFFVVTHPTTKERTVAFTWRNSTGVYRMNFVSFRPSGAGGRGEFDAIRTGPSGTSAPFVCCAPFFFKGSLYGRAFRTTQAQGNVQWDVQSSVLQLSVAPENYDYAHGKIFSIDDRLFFIAPAMESSTGGSGAGFTNTTSVEELIAGVWTDRAADGWVHNFCANRPGIASQDGPASLAVVKIEDPSNPGNVAVYVMGGGNNIDNVDANGGLCLIKITVPVPGGPTVMTDLTGVVVPATLRPQVGGGVAFPQELHAFGFVDDQTDPANPVAYFVVAPTPSQTTAQPVALFRFNDDTTELTNIGTVQADSHHVFPDSSIGSGHLLLAPPSSNALVEGYLEGPGDSGAAGVRLRFRMAGDPLLLEHGDNDWLLKHGAVTGGPFQVGEIVTASATGAVAQVTAVNAGSIEVAGVESYVDQGEGFTGGDTITGGTSGATAVLNVFFRLPFLAGAGFTVAETVRRETQGGTSDATVVAVNATDLEITAPTGSRFLESTIVGLTSATRAEVHSYPEPVAGRFEEGEVVQGGTSGAEATVDRINFTSLELGSSNGIAFQAGETITGLTSGATRTLSTILRLGVINNGPYVIGETVTGGTSGATGTVTRARDNWNGYGSFLAIAVTGGVFQNGEVVTGGTSGATATTLSAGLPSLGGTAIHSARFRYHKAPGPTGKGVPNGPGGVCTLVAGTLTGGAATLNGNLVENLTADRRTIYEVEWDFLADGISQTQIEDVKVEAIRG